MEAQDEFFDEMDDSAEADEIVTFTLKKHHFYAGLVPIAFVLGIVAGFIIWGDQPGTENASSSTAPQAQTSGEPRRYDIPIAAGDPARGPANAPITLVEFSDFECPYCRSYFLNTLPRILEAYPNQIRHVFKDLPLISIHANAFPAAVAALCAHEQGAFWEFHDLLFGMELSLGTDAYQQYAADLGLSQSKFTNCLDAQRYTDQVQADYDFAIQLGVRSTPTFFINGILIVGAQPFEVFSQIIESELGNTAQ